MNKSELVSEIAKRTNLPTGDVALVVDHLLEVIRGVVTGGGKVVLSGFGTFHRVARAGRVARNIGAGEPVVVPPTNVPAFRPGKPFREAVARPPRRSVRRSGPRGAARRA